MRGQFGFAYCDPLEILEILRLPVNMQLTIQLAAEVSSRFPLQMAHQVIIVADL